MLLAEVLHEDALPEVPAAMPIPPSPPWLRASLEAEPDELLPVAPPLADELEDVRRTLAESGIEGTVRQLVRGKDAADEIGAVAEEVGATLVVIGLRKRTPVGKLVLGSNSQKILLNTASPVLAVKA